MELLNTINNQIKEIPELTLKIVDIDRVNEQPHPFCIGSSAIQRYHLDMTKPCAMRTNPTTGEWANKRITKKGIIDTCSLSFEQHTFEHIILIELLADSKAQVLEDALHKGTGKLKAIFDEHSIIGFNFVKTKPQYYLKN